MARARTVLPVAALALALVVVLGWAGRVVWDRFDRTDLERALAALPDSSVRIGFTDWRAVRAEVGADLGDTPDREAVETMVRAAFERDVSSVSAVDGAAGAMQQLFGFGPGTAQWEVFGQGADGAAVVLRPPDGTDFSVLGDNLASAGFQRPAETDGVWRGGIDLVASLDPALTPVVQYVALLPGPGLVVASDDEAYAGEAAAVAAGDGDDVLGEGGVRDLADRMAGTVASMTWVGDFACRDLAMSRAAADAQQAAAARVAELGGVTPLEGLAMGLLPDGTLRVAAHFADADRAERNLRPRAELAAGTAYGRGGEFGSTLQITRARTSGPDVLLDLAPARSGVFLLSGLYDGPLVFATC